MIYLESYTDFPRSTESVVDASLAVAARLGLGIHHVRAFRTPGGLKVDLHMEVPASMALRAAHERADDLEAELRAEMPELHHVEIHIEPRHQEFHELTSGDTSDVAEQVARAAETQVTGGVHDISVLVGRQGYVVSLHCYLRGDMPIAEAHYRTAEIERAIRESVPGIYRVTVHPEPFDGYTTYPLEHENQTPQNPNKQAPHTET